MIFLAKKRFFLATLAFMLAFPFFCAFAADTEEKFDLKNEVRKCAEIVGRIERLICFDEASKKAGFMTVEQAAREEKIVEKYGFWEVTRRKTTTGEEVMYLKNNAAEDVKLQSGMKRLPTFVIMCKHGRTDAYLDWKSRLSPYYLGGFSKIQVVFQLDAGERRLTTWELSTDRQAAFIPEPMDFIKDLRKHEKLILQITPMHELAQTILFDVSGLEKVLDILVENCYN